jgi:hypothetical protein
VPDLWPLRRPAGDRRLKVPLSTSRIAVDLLGGDAGPDIVVDVVVTDGFTGNVYSKAWKVRSARFSPAAVASCIGAAASAAREGLVPRLTAALAALVAHRRAEPPPSRLMPA